MTEADFSVIRACIVQVSPIPYTTPIHSSQHGEYPIEHIGTKLTDVASGQSNPIQFPIRSNIQNDYMDEHRRRHGRRMDYEEKK
jgi:hypothetical protein